MLTLLKDNYRFQREQSKTMLHPQNFLEQRPLTTEELSQVHFVTIREGVNHCRWPREVIEQFLAVEA